MGSAQLVCGICAQGLITSLSCWDLQDKKQRLTYDSRVGGYGPELLAVSFTGVHTFPPLAAGLPAGGAAAGAGARPRFLIDENLWDEPAAAAIALVALVQAEFAAAGLPAGGGT